MKTKCVIVDDEPIAVSVIRSHLQQFKEIQIVAECGSAIEAFEILKSKTVDLIFLDIQMPELTGLDFLRSISNPPKVIITTAYRDYALEGYELDVVDYLLKPIPFDRFLKAVNKYYQLTSDPAIQLVKPSDSQGDDFLYVRSNKKVYKIKIEDIIYLESMREYVKIHTTEGEIITKSPLTNFENNLPSERFIRIHKSFIVAFNYIKSFSSTSFYVNGTELPLSRGYKIEALKQMGYKKDI
jgi:DNA-binding LytR/AlgR family response regulator